MHYNNTNELLYVIMHIRVLIQILDATVLITDTSVHYLIFAYGHFSANKVMHKDGKKYVSWH